MLNESKYYENDNIWNPDRYAGIETARVQTTIALLPTDVQSVLDAGCGNGVLTNLLTDIGFSVGIDRSYSALQWVKMPHIQGDITNLPFRNNSFDAVISTEVIEHLPINGFKKGLKEISRLARKYVVISVPYCEDLEAFRTTCPSCGNRFHRTYHMRSFDHEFMTTLFPSETGLRLAQLNSIFPTKTARLNSLRHSMNNIKRQFGFEKQKFPIYATCPQCGYAKENDTSSIATSVNTIHTSWRLNMSKIIRRLEPTILKPRWWLALYVK